MTFITMIPASATRQPIDTFFVRHDPALDLYQFRTGERQLGDELHLVSYAYAPFFLAHWPPAATIRLMDFHSLSVPGRTGRLLLHTIRLDHPSKTPAALFQRHGNSLRALFTCSRNQPSLKRSTITSSRTRCSSPVMRYSCTVYRNGNEQRTQVHGRRRSGHGLDGAVRPARSFACYPACYGAFSDKRVCGPN